MAAFKLFIQIEISEFFRREMKIDLKDCYRPKGSPLTKATISIIRNGNRMIDHFALQTLARQVVREMIRNKVFADDSWSVLGTWQVHQRACPRGCSDTLEILIQGLPDKRN